MGDHSHTDYQDGRKPPERVPKSERILNLIAVLLRADKPVPVTDILGKVTGYDDKASRESLMRRFERDKKVLRDIGIPIEHSPQGTFGQEGYSISRRDYFLDELRLPPESGRILRLLYAWAHQDGGELSADLRSALVKLGYLVEEEESGPPPNPTETLEPARLDPKLASGPVVGLNLERLSEAVLLRKRVRFTYYTFGRDDEYEVEVDPYGLGFSSQAWNQGAWYLVGFSHARQALRVFKVQRIRGEVAIQRPGEGEDFPAPPGFRVRDHLGKTRWEYKDLASAFTGKERSEAFTARIAFERGVSAEVRSYVPSARVLEGESDAKHEVLEFEVHHRRPFVRFLLRYVPRLRVLAPRDLESSLRDMAREVVALYRGGASA